VPAPEDLFIYYGRVEKLEMPSDLQRHLRNQGHNVRLTEIADVLAQGRARFFRNVAAETGTIPSQVEQVEAERRAPLLMVGPTRAGRILCVPIEPTGRFGVWRPITAYDAGERLLRRYHGAP
jgi:hypothetical protein